MALQRFLGRTPTSLALVILVSSIFGTAQGQTRCNNPSSIQINYQEQAPDRAAQKAIFASAYERANDECQLAKTSFPQFRCKVAGVYFNQDFRSVASHWVIAINLELCPKTEAQQKN